MAMIRGWSRGVLGGSRFGGESAGGGGGDGVEVDQSKDARLMLRLVMNTIYFIERNLPIKDKGTRCFNGRVIVVLNILYG